MWRVYRQIAEAAVQRALDVLDGKAEHKFPG
jgi:hypothetical protein